MFCLAISTIVSHATAILISVFEAVIWSIMRLRMFSKCAFIINAEFYFCKSRQKCCASCFLQPCNSYLCFVNTMQTHVYTRYNSLRISCYQLGHASVQASEGCMEESAAIL